MRSLPATASRNQVRMTSISPGWASMPAIMPVGTVRPASAACWKAVWTVSVSPKVVVPKAHLVHPPGDDRNTTFADQGLSADLLAPASLAPGITPRLSPLRPRSVVVSRGQRGELDYRRAV